MYLCVCVRVQVHLHACVCVCVCECACVQVYLHACVSVCLYMSKRNMCMYASTHRLTLCSIPAECTYCGEGRGSYVSEAQVMSCNPQTFHPHASSCLTAQCSKANCHGRPQYRSTPPPLLPTTTTKFSYRVDCETAWLWRIHHLELTSYSQQPLASIPVRSSPFQWLPG